MATLEENSLNNYVHIDKACEWWLEEFTYPNISEEELNMYKERINAFRNEMIYKK